MARKGVLKERLLQIVSITTQAAISSRVNRFKLQLQDRQDSRRQGGRDDRHTPMAWEWSEDAEGIVSNKKKLRNKGNKWGRSKIGWKYVASGDYPLAYPWV